MINRDQPTCFPDDLLVRVSSISDGTMLNRQEGLGSQAILGNRREFCKSVSADYDQLTFMWIDYQPGASYSVVSQIDVRHQSRTVLADALLFDSSGIGAFLPLADCVGMVIYDPGSRQTAVLHLGRHSTLTNLIDKVMVYFSKPENLIVWMSPSASKSSYAMDYFDHKHQASWKDFCRELDGKIYLDLPGYNRQRLLGLGLKSENIHISPVDTVTNQDYFSHSAGDKSGRFGLVVVRR